MDHRAEDILREDEDDGLDEQAEPAGADQASKLPISKTSTQSRGARTPWEIHCEQVGSHTVPTRAEEQELIQRFRGGDQQAGDELIMRNQRFVTTIAGQFKGYGFDIMDLIQEGNLGLLKAAEKFDLNRKTRFITYAVYWVKAFMNHYILANIHLAIRPSTQASRRIFWKYGRQKANFIEVHRREPTDEEMAAILSAKPKEIRQHRDLKARVLSLSQPVRGNDGEDPSGTLMEDRLSDPNASTSEQRMASPEALRRVQGGIVEQLMENLGPQDKEIIKLRFLGEDPRTLKEVGNAIGLSSERVRQRVERALRNMERRARRLGITADGLLTED